MNENEDIVYSGALKRQQLKIVFKVMWIYIFDLIFWLVVARLYGPFGSKWIIPSISAMWIVGAFTVLRVKEERENTIKETKRVIISFLAFLLLYRMVIQLVAPISASQMQASLHINVPAASASAASGMLMNILVISSVMVPIGFLIWCGKKFTTYSGGMTKADAFNKIKDIRNK